MKIKSMVFIRVIIFLIITVLMAGALSSFFQPVWVDWNNYYTTYGFYSQPENTIESLFLGSSVVANAVAPTQLYSDYGLCAYNLATEQQPVLASYYWIEEAYRLHPETLKIVVFDVSELRSESDEAYYHKALDAMKFSSVKYRAVKDYKKGNLFDTLNFMVPLLSYHNRWNAVEEIDFDKYSFDPDNGSRGYNYEDQYYYESSAKDGTDVQVLNPVLDKSANKAKLVENSVHYFEKIVAFCKEHNIKLVPIKTTVGQWNSYLHNAVQELMDKHGLEFLDFNFDPLYSEYGYVHAFDCADNRHFNWFGATKFTKWMGMYLVEKCGATDIRNDERFDFMKDNLKEYKLKVLNKVELYTSETPHEYVKKALSEDNVVFLSVKSEAAKKLSDETKAYFESIGLTEFSKIKKYNSYVAAIDNKGVLYEQLKVIDDEQPITQTGRLKDGVSYRVVSGGYKQGNISSCLINGGENSLNMNGLNIVVYSYELNYCIDQTCFDTHTAGDRDRYTLDSLSEVDITAEYDKNSILYQVQHYQTSVDKRRNK